MLIEDQFDTKDKAHSSAQVSPGLIAAFGVFAVGIGAVGYEVGRRRKR